MASVDLKDQHIQSLANLDYTNLNALRNGQKFLNGRREKQTTVEGIRRFSNMQLVNDVCIANEVTRLAKKAYNAD
jgi:hypothetical protein